MIWLVVGAIILTVVVVGYICLMVTAMGWNTFATALTVTATVLFSVWAVIHGMDQLK